MARRSGDARASGQLDRLTGFDDTVAYVAARSPISNPYTRWQQAERKQNKTLIEASKAYFRPWETIHEANPHEILERKESVVLRPLLIMQGELDGEDLHRLEHRIRVAISLQ